MTTWLASETIRTRTATPDDYLKRETELTLDAGLTMLLDGIAAQTHRHNQTVELD